MLVAAHIDEKYITASSYWLYFHRDISIPETAVVDQTSNPLCSDPLTTVRVDKHGLTEPRSVKKDFVLSEYEDEKIHTV